MAYTTMFPRSRLDPVTAIKQNWDSGNSRAEGYRTKLHLKLLVYPSVKFDHMQIGCLERADMLCVFVVKDGQSTVLYDAVRDFPSKRLLASLTLLGSP